MKEKMNTLEGELRSLKSREMPDLVQKLRDDLTERMDESKARHDELSVKMDEMHTEFKTRSDELSAELQELLQRTLEQKQDANTKHSGVEIKVEEVSIRLQKETDRFLVMNNHLFGELLQVQKKSDEALEKIRSVEDDVKSALEMEHSKMDKLELKANLTRGLIASHLAYRPHEDEAIRQNVTTSVENLSQHLNKSLLGIANEHSIFKRKISNLGSLISKLERESASGIHVSKLEESLKNLDSTTRAIRDEVEQLDKKRDLRDDVSEMQKTLGNHTSEIGALNKQLLDIQHSCAGDPPSLRHGKATDFERKPGSSVGYECDRNFLMTGNSTVRCKLGKWEGHPPTCKETSGKGAMPLSVTPEDVTLSEGSSSMLPCNTRHPNASIRWTKDDVLLIGETPLPGLKFLPNNSLWIRNMERHLAGMYTCKAMSPESEVVTSTFVTMIDCDMDLIRTPSDSEYAEGDFAHMECMSLSGQTVLTWEKDGQPLVTDDRVKLLSSGFIAIRRVRFEDDGTYTCVAADTASDCVRRLSAILVVHDPRIRDVCGRIKEPEKESRGKIVGGQDALEGSYPWHVMLRHPRLGPFCGATLIDDRWLVTAAQCLVDRGIVWSDILILLGKHERELGREPEVEAQLAGPSSMRIHPSFHKATFDNDLALLQLSRPVSFTDRVLPACLGNRNVSETLLSAGTPGRVIGWGRMRENGYFPRYLRQVTLPVVDQALCRASTNFTVTSNMFCAGYAQELVGDTCAGDSGGPFLAQHEGRWHIVGVSSWGEGCGRRGKYGFYTRIANHLSWIRNVTSHGDTSE